MLRKLPISLLLKVAALLWVGCAAFSFACLSKLDRTAGAAGHPPVRWQTSVPIALDKKKPTLIVLMHPQCPCSRASLYELDRLAALCPNQASISVLFLKPAGCSLAWTKTDLWRSASAIPGVCVRVDEQGKIARRLGAATSGDAVLYAPDGRLLYQGGLTGERGHEGDNAGLSALADLLHGKILSSSLTSAKNKPVTEPVYGCPLTADRHAKVLEAKALGGTAWLP